MSKKRGTFTEAIHVLIVAERDDENLKFTEYRSELYSAMRFLKSAENVRVTREGIVDGNDLHPLRVMLRQLYRARAVHAKGERT
jgi:hypothetical protein